ncbi:hypothetical protein GCM10027347_18870 [Larkinella harenae]
MLSATITARPAAGPLTLTSDPDRKPITNPPIIPATRPENKGAPEARAIPKQRGKATKNTDNPAGRSDLKVAREYEDKVFRGLKISMIN